MPRGQGIRFHISATTGCLGGDTVVDTAGDTGGVTPSNTTCDNICDTTSDTTGTGVSCGILFRDPLFNCSFFLKNCH